jgi:hypothetical protein
MRNYLDVNYTLLFNDRYCYIGILRFFNNDVLLYGM